MIGYAGKYFVSLSSIWLILSLVASEMYCTGSSKNFVRQVFIGMMLADVYNIYNMWNTMIMELLYISLYECTIIKGIKTVSRWRNSFKIKVNR